MSKRELYQLRDHGTLELVARDLYRPAGAPLSIWTIAERAPQVAFCPTSALAFHDLTDAIPAEHDVALPRCDRLTAVVDGASGRDKRSGGERH